MRWISIALSVLLLAVAAIANPNGESRLNYNPMRLQLAQAMTQTPEQPAPADSTTAAPEIAGKLVPGKALLLSMILPGTGQIYAKSPLWGALFMAVEVGAWAGVAVYHQKGMNKDDEFHTYAEQHWAYNRDAIQPNTLAEFNDYSHYEYWAATIFGKDGQTGGDPGYTGLIDEWQSLSWTEKLLYLPSDGFTHELDPNKNDQQYYEMIGKYNQFGAGWPTLGDSDLNYRAATRTTWQWETKNSFRETYLNMRKESNDALNSSKDFTMVVMANHLLSALHAGFAVSVHNRKLAKEHAVEGAFRLESRRYDNEQVTMGVFRLNF
ncbi:MAG: hypothetical protein NTW14_06790 [bacterium]|nr:hypothetical protein [bacterium]